MKNRIDITTDGINAYAKIKVNASRTGIRILSIFIIAELMMVVWIFSQIKSEEVMLMIIPILIGVIFVVGLPVKYLLWNKQVSGQKNNSI